MYYRRVEVTRPRVREFVCSPLQAGMMFFERLKNGGQADFLV